MNQCTWSEEKKLILWQRIVTMKIKNQRLLLDSLNIKFHESLLKYENRVLPGDKNNCEASAARIYFKALFGRNFTRHSADDINSALNYGYILILNTFNRILSMHGYHAAIGIKHQNRKNKFNLSCDLMEPFRPFIDKIVFNNVEKPFDWNYKKILIESLQKKIRYGNREMSLSDVCENYSLDILSAINGKNYCVKELYLV